MKRLTTGAARRRLVIAVAGYAVVGVFTLVYGIVRSRWPDLTQVSSVTIAGLAAAPLALALLWDRLGGFKAFGLEITLSAVSARMDIEVVGTITEQQYFSGNEAIVERITQAIVRPEQELLELNLRDGNYWWSTRLFLLAALAEDYARIQRLVFVERGHERSFVGMADPGDVRRALARAWPTLELSYQTIKMRPPLPPPSQPSASVPSRIVLGFAANTFEREGKPVGEQDLMMKTNPTLLHDWLIKIGRPLDANSVDWAGITDPRLVRSLLLEFDAPYIALLRHGRLDRVVSRLDLALRVARKALG